MQYVKHVFTISFCLFLPFHLQEPLRVSISEVCLAKSSKDVRFEESCEQRRVLVYMETPDSSTLPSFVPGK